MPKLSLREIRADLARRLSSSNLVSLELIVEAPDGSEIIRAGGVWDPSLNCYVPPPPDYDHTPQRIRCQPSQVALVRGYARWFEKARAGDTDRVPLILAAGNRGSGKTFAAQILTHLVALEWPGDEQFIVVLNTENRRECVEHLHVIGRHDWIAIESEDPRRVFTQWVNGARVNWISSRNPNKLQQGGLPIRRVLLNEAHLMSEIIAAKAQLVGRNLGALLDCAFNPPISDGGNWTARIWFACESGDARGEHYLLRNQDNAAVDHQFLDAAGTNVRVISPTVAAADVDGTMRPAGAVAYESFDGRPFNLSDPKTGGSVGAPPDLGWPDVTRDLTAKDFGGGTGADYVCGLDFQRRPGVIGNIAKIYRRPDGVLVLWIKHQIAVRGVEPEFSQALIDAGYSANGYLPDGRQAPVVLLVGDATGARQNSEHQFAKPPSFNALRADGWAIVPPTHHWKRRTPWNPDVKASVSQMYELFERREILLSIECKQAPAAGFPSLVDSFRNAKKYIGGKLKEEGNFQHGPDGVRYLAWKFLARPQPPKSERDPNLIRDLRSITLEGR